MVEAKAIFASIDTAGSGSLSLPEMHRKLSDFGLEEQTIERLFYGEPSRCSFGAHRSHTAAGRSAGRRPERRHQRARVHRGLRGVHARAPGRGARRRARRVPAEGHAARQDGGAGPRGAGDALAPRRLGPRAQGHLRRQRALGGPLNAGPRRRLHLRWRVGRCAFPCPAAPPPTRRTAHSSGIARAGHGGTPCSEFVEGAAFGKPAALPSHGRAGERAAERGGRGALLPQRRSLRASRRAAATPRRGPTATRASTAAS